MQISDAASGKSGTGQADADRARLGIYSGKMYHYLRSFGSNTADRRAKSDRG
jgi:hypothetical protein